MFSLKNTLTVGISALAISTLNPTNGHALEPLESAPAAADFVAYVDVHAVVESGTFQMFLDHQGREEITNVTRFIENATDVNVFEDIHHVWIFGQVENDEAALLFINADYNEEKLLDMVRLNSSYDDYEIDGYEIHHWVDDGEKYVTFVDDYIVFGGSEEAIEAYIETAENPDLSIATTDIFENADPNMLEQPLWAMLINGEDTRGDFGELAEGIELDYALLNIYPGETSIEGTLTIHPEDTFHLEHYNKVVQGFLGASFLLQEELEPAALVTEKVTTTVNEEEGVVILEAELSNREFFEILEEL